MADIAVTANAVAMTRPTRSIVRPFIAANAIAVGQSVYQNTSGLVDLASSAASGTRQFLGVALCAAAAGQNVDVLLEGEVSGFTLTTIAYDGLVYLSDNAGNYADAAGTTAVVVGRVVAKSDNVQTKLVYIQRKWTALW